MVSKDIDEFIFPLYINTKEIFLKCKKNMNAMRIVIQ